LNKLNKLGWGAILVAIGAMAGAGGTYLQGTTDLATLLSTLLAGLTAIIAALKQTQKTPPV